MEYALAWQVYESALCEGCSQPFAESMAPGSDMAYEAEAVRCFGCRAKARAAEGFDDRDGLLFRVKRVD